ncbi:MAG: hypothetical protein EOO77_46680, partial [Oxalobacteraceae bacterium]
RQVIRVSLGGKQIRLRFSNEFGTVPLTLTSVHVAKPASGGAIHAETDRQIYFQGKPVATIPAGAFLLSDPISFDLPLLSDLVVTLHTQTASDKITGHPGARCTSYLCEGEHVREATLPGVSKVEHWYFLSGVEVPMAKGQGTIVALGDSITDGRGTPTDGNGRWTDFLMQRLQGELRTRDRVAVLNAGIGGNCVVHGGLGPTALSRLDRSVLCSICKEPFSGPVSIPCGHSFCSHVSSRSFNHRTKLMYSAFGHGWIRTKSVLAVMSQHRKVE